MQHMHRKRFVQCVQKLPVLQTLRKRRRDMRCLQVMIESRHRADTRTLKKLLVAFIIDVVACFWEWRTLRTLDKRRRCLYTFRSS
jgi:hypothetical protein